MAEIGGGGQRSEIRGQRAEVRGQRSGKDRSRPGEISCAVTSSISLGKEGRDHPSEMRSARHGHELHGVKRAEGKKVSCEFKEFKS